jgi:hypothetical protein
MSKRFQTYFKIPVPPFKEEKLGSGSTTIRFIVSGNIPSKKNNTMAVTIRSDAKYYLQSKAVNGMISLKDAKAAVNRVHSKVRGNQEYQKWVKEQKPIILEQMHTWIDRLQEKGLVFPLEKATMSVRFYFNNNYNIDSINKGQSIQDLLVECKVLKDDSYRVLNPIHYASANYKDELVDSICFVSISFKL